MRDSLYITTSWDDGHPWDLRLAEMLADSGLPATFYIPRRSEHPTLSGEQLRLLARRFDIGAHTLDHVDLLRVPGHEALVQIAGSKKWLEDTLGRGCRMFCPPLGHFKPTHAKMIEASGFLGMRTVELLSLSHPRPFRQLAVIPTTLQAHPHRRSDYLRNALRRGRCTQLWRSLWLAGGGDWEARAERLLQQATETGGVFHLWGHSWEIHQHDQWQRLGRVLKMLGRCDAVKVDNSQLCEMALRRWTSQRHSTRSNTLAQTAVHPSPAPAPAPSPDQAGLRGSAIG